MHVQSSVFIRICPKGWYRRIAERSVSYLSKGGERCVCCVEEEEEAEAGEAFIPKTERCWEEYERILLLFSFVLRRNCKRSRPEFFS